MGGLVPTTCLRIIILLLGLSGGFLIQVGALPETIKIGGLFDVWDKFEETAFRHAVQRVNADANILPRTALIAQLERLPTGDSFHASKKVCQILKDGVVGILGPQSPSTSSHVQSVCDALEVPHVETKWDYRSSHGNFLINLYPHPTTLSRAFADILEAWGWNRYVVIYENNESLIRLQDILKASHPDRRQTTVKQLPAGDDYRPLFKEIRMQTDITSLIIDCDTSKLPLIFEHASQVGMMRNYRYFVTSLDVQTIDIDMYLFGDINITSFRMVDRDTPEMTSVLRQWQNLVEFGFQEKSSTSDLYVDETFVNSRAANRHRSSQFPSSGSREPIPPLRHGMMKTETALIYDAITLYARALQALDTSQRGTLSTRSLNCDPANPAETWKEGHLLMDVLKKVQFQGLTGIVQFDPAGYRINFQLDVMELTPMGLAKIGVWDSRPNRNNEHFEWTRTRNETLKLQEEDLRNKTLIVSTKQSDPYFIVIKNSSGDSYEGYAIDLLDLLSETLHFKYVVREAADGGYGSPNNKSKFGWDGVVGEILAGVADLGIGDMTITHDREKTLDFTMPFMNLGISILYKKPDKQPPSLFSFLEPFHIDVWIYMSTAYLGVSLILFVLARVAPAQWTNPHPCKEDPDELENDLSMLNSLWFSIGSLMQQGSDVAPKAASTRTVAGIWWFFTLIMISSYTANLAAFLTSEGMEEGVKDIKDLPKQTKVKYGSIGSGSTYQFFKGSSFPLYKEIYNNMQNTRPTPYVTSTKEGVDRVKKSDGKYAFFMESSSIEYQTERDCKLTMLGGPLDSKGYGIALRKNSKYRDAFNSRILELQEKGELEKLKVKWWGKEKGGGKCTSGKIMSSGGAQPLTLGHVGGVFVVLLGGCGLACIMAFVEFLWKSRKLAQNEGVMNFQNDNIRPSSRKEEMIENDESLLAEMGKELRFALQCKGETKPIRKKNLVDASASEGGSVPYLAFPRDPVPL